MAKRKQSSRRPWRGGRQFEPASRQPLASSDRPGKRPRADGVLAAKPTAARRAKDEIDQTDLCLINTHGSMWMKGYFDRLPLSVRQRLRDSEHNLCSACLVVEYVPKARSRHPNYSRTQALLVGIEWMEREVRRRDAAAPGRRL